MYRSTVNTLILFVILSGCAHQPDTLSIRHKQAMDWAQQGEHAYFSGNLEQSRQYYEKALLDHSAIEHQSGIAAVLLCLAQIHLDLGEYDKAEARLQLVLANNLNTANDRAEAAARLAQLALLLKQADKALVLAEQAQTLCEKCALMASILNLQAEAAYAQGKLQKSADLAQLAAAIAEKLEQANAWRLLAQIRLSQGDAANAVIWLEQALPADKQLGLPKKIIEDLGLLAEAKEKLGLYEEAESCRSRIRAIRLALGDKFP